MSDDRSAKLLDLIVKKPDEARTEAGTQERPVIGYQLNRHTGWFKQLSKATKVRLAPEP